MATATAKRSKNHSKSRSATAGRIDVVFIRKSGSKQDETGQIDNVRRMLTSDRARLESNGIEITKVSDNNWFVCTVPRSKVSANEDFKRLRKLVEEDRIRNVYIESQSRFGTKNAAELWTLIGLLQSHECHLIDLKQAMDLTKVDDVTEISVTVGAIKSRKERDELAYQSLRTKVGRLESHGAWPSGSHPFGFAKQCFALHGQLRWEWQPSSRTIGHHFYADAKGKLVPGQQDCRIQPHDRKSEYTKLVPSTNKKFVDTIKTIFKLFVHEPMTYRGLSTYLNDRGRCFYDKPFTHSLIREILHNPAYVGDTHYGKHKTAEYHSFNSDWVIEKIDTQVKQKRGEEDQLIKRRTHKGLIDRQTWKLAQQRIAAMKERPITPPKHAEYYLKPILVCGHCGKNMVGSMEGKGDGKFIVYFCSTYRSGKSVNQKVACGAHRITHADAEKLIFNKIKEAKLQYKEFADAFKRGDVDPAVLKAEMHRENASEEEQRLIQEGIEALRSYYDENYDSSQKEKSKFYDFSRMQYGLRGLTYRDTKQFRQIVLESEAEAVAAAKKTVAALEKRHRELTDAFSDPKATSMMKDSYLSQIAQVERDTVEWKERVRPMSERIQDARQSTRHSAEQLRRLEDQWPEFELREKGEALRRIFKTVTLYWDKEFVPKRDKPSRELKTDRPGRNRFTLLKNKIAWDFQPINSVASW